MSLQTERIAIETYFFANWTATPYGLDGQPFTPAINTVQMFIADGAVMQASIGRTLNTYNNLGLVTFVVYTDGALGSSAWRGYAETLINLFLGKTLDATGALVTGSGQTPLVRFSPPELGDNRQPYIGPVTLEAPLRRTNVIVPFVRYETH